MDTVLPLLSSLRLRFSASPRHTCYCSYLHPARRRTEGVHLRLLGRLQVGSALKWDHVHAGSRRQQVVVMAVGKSSTKKTIQPVEEMRERKANSEVSSSPAVDNAVTVVQPKRKRGRPKKVQDVFEEKPTTASNKAQEATSKGQSEEAISLQNNSLEEEKNAQGLSEDEEIEKFLLGGNWTIKIEGKEDSNQDEEDDDDDDDEDDQPLWVDEDDPTWPPEGEDGWGFRTSQFFEDVQIRPDKQKSNDEDGEDDEDDEDDDEHAINWETEADNWVIKEITANDWEATVFADPSPLVVYLFARYGPSRTDGWNMLKELEKAVETIWESRKAPLRGVKVDVGLEIDLASALQIHVDECPALLFIKNGKGFFRLEGFRNSEELMQIMAHCFYNGARPSCLDQTPTTKTVKRIAEV